MLYCLVTKHARSLYSLEYVIALQARLTNLARAVYINLAATYIGGDNAEIRLETLQGYVRLLARGCILELQDVTLIFQYSLHKALWPSVTYIGRYSCRWGPA